MPGLFKKKIKAFEQVSFVTFGIFWTLRENHLANSEVLFNREIRVLGTFSAKAPQKSGILSLVFFYLKRSEPFRFTCDMILKPLLHLRGHYQKIPHSIKQERPHI